MKSSVKKTLTLFFILILFTFFYLLSFRLPLENFISVYTYKGIFLLLIVSILLLVALVTLKKNFIKSIDVKDITIVILIFFLVNLLVFCMVPVTLERAYSVFMLSEMSKQDEQILDVQSAENLFMNSYLKDNGAIDKRFQEQMVTGTVVQVDTDTYQLTNKGTLFVNLFHFFDKIYNVNSKLLK